jgi:hypothetical protein
MREGERRVAHQAINKKQISQMDLLMDLNLSVILLVKMAHHHNF